MAELRKVEIFVDNNWKEIKFEELEVGDRYRMFEPAGERVVGINYEDEWVVTRGPTSREEDGVSTVECIDAKYKRVK